MRCADRGQPLGAASTLSPFPLLPARRQRNPWGGWPLASARRHRARAPPRADNHGERNCVQATQGRNFMTAARARALGAAVAMICVLATLPVMQTAYVSTVNAAGPGLPGPVSRPEPRQNLTLVDCRSTVVSNCRNRERSCLQTSRSSNPRGECRRLYGCCLISSLCLQGRYAGPGAFMIDRGGRAPPTCLRLLVPFTCSTGCNPAMQRCLCITAGTPDRTIRGTPNPDGSIEVRRPR